MAGEPGHRAGSYTDGTCSSVIQERQTLSGGCETFTSGGERALAKPSGFRARCSGTRRRSRQRVHAVAQVDPAVGSPDRRGRVAAAPWRKDRPRRFAVFEFTVETVRATPARSSGGVVDRASQATDTNVRQNGLVTSSRRATSSYRTQPARRALVARAWCITPTTCARTRRASKSAAIKPRRPRWWAS